MLCYTLFMPESLYISELVCCFLLSKLSCLKADFYIKGSAKESPPDYASTHPCHRIFCRNLQTSWVSTPPFLNMSCAHTADNTALHPLRAPCPLSCLEPTAPGFRPSKTTVDSGDLSPGTTLRAHQRAGFRRGRGAKKTEIKNYIYVSINSYFCSCSPGDAASLGCILRACSVRAGIRQRARCVLSEGGVVVLPDCGCLGCSHALFHSIATLPPHDVLISGGGLKAAGVGGGV